jgi:ribosomal protein S18 acetylase RimI-like enzyme
MWNLLVIDMIENLESCNPKQVSQAMQENMYEIFRVNGRSPLYKVEETPEIIRMSHGAKEASYQGVGYANLNEENIDETIESVISYFREHHLPFMWYIGPDSTPENLGEALQSHGLSYGGNAPAMAINLCDLEERALPQGFTVEPVDDLDKLRTFFDLWCESYPFPQGLGDIYYHIFTSEGFKLDHPNRFYVGYLDGEPVASSRVFLGEKVASLWWVSCHPSARGKGIGSAMTYFPLNEAMSDGYNVGSLYATKMGAHVYPKLGFKEYHKLEVYVQMPDQAHAFTP